jgi:hypothetical protein
MKLTASQWSTQAFQYLPVMVLADESEKIVSGLHELCTILARVEIFETHPYAPHGQLENKTKSYLMPLDLTGSRVHVLLRRDNPPPITFFGR